jgi:Predicted nucleotide kinase
MEKGTIIAVTGSIGAGKSTLLIGLAATLKGMGIATAGLISARLSRHGERSGYELLNLTCGNVEPLATLTPPEPGTEHLFLPLCHLFFYRQALHAGNDAIRDGLGADCLIVDEIGHWELSGGGWADHLHLLQERKGPTILGMRIGIAQDLERLYGIRLAHTVRLNLSGKETAMKELLEFVTLGRKLPSGASEA